MEMTKTAIIWIVTFFVTLLAAGAALTPFVGHELAGLLASVAALVASIAASELYLEGR